MPAKSHVQYFLASVQDRKALLVARENRGDFTAHKGGIRADEYENIIFEGLSSLINTLREPPDDPEMIQIADENTFSFMQHNVSLHKLAFSNLKKIILAL